MSAPGFEIILVPAPDEILPENLTKLQKEFAALPVNRKSSRLIIAVGAVAGAAVGSVMGSSFIVTLGPLGILTAIIGGGAGAAVATVAGKIVLKSLPTLQSALETWLKAKYGRKVRLKVGELEAEAQTIEEVERLLARAQKIQQQNQPPKIIP